MRDGEETLSPVGHLPEEVAGHRRFPSFTARETNLAMVLALLAWTVAVFDYGLFGTLLPAMTEDFGWTPEQSYLINTLIAVGTAIVAFGVGPVIDRLGRRRGMMVTIGGPAGAPALNRILATKAAWAGVTSAVAAPPPGGLGFFGASAGLEGARGGEGV